MLGECLFGDVCWWCVWTGQATLQGHLRNSVADDLEPTLPALPPSSLPPLVRLLPTLSRPTPYHPPRLIQATCPLPVHRLPTPCPLPAHSLPTPSPLPTLRPHTAITPTPCHPPQLVRWQRGSVTAAAPDVLRVESSQGQDPIHSITLVRKKKLGRGAGAVAPATRREAGALVPLAAANWARRS